MSSYQNGDKHMKGLGWNKSTKLSRLFDKLEIQAEDHADFVINTHRMEGDFVPIINSNKEKVKAKAKGRKINYFADDEYFTVYLFFGEEDKIAADLMAIPPPPKPADMRKSNEDLIKSVNMPNFIVHTGSLSDAIKKGKVWASDREPPEYRVTVGKWKIIVQPETGAEILSHYNLSWCKHDELVALVGLVSSGKLKELDPTKHIRYSIFMEQIPKTGIYVSFYDQRHSQAMLVVKNGIKAVKYPKKYEKGMKEALERETSLTISLTLCRICKIPD